MKKRNLHFGAPLPDIFCPERGAAAVLSAACIFFSYFTHVAVQSCLCFCVKQARWSRAKLVAHAPASAEMSYGVASDPFGSRSAVTSPSAPKTYSSPAVHNPQNTWCSAAASASG